MMRTRDAEVGFANDRHDLSIILDAHLSAWCDQSKKTILVASSHTPDLSDTSANDQTVLWFLVALEPQPTGLPRCAIHCFPIHTTSERASDILDDLVHVINCRASITMQKHPRHHSILPGSRYPTATVPLECHACMIAFAKPATYDKTLIMLAICLEQFAGYQIKPTLSLFYLRSFLSWQLTTSVRDAPFEMLCGSDSGPAQPALDMLAHWHAYQFELLQQLHYRRNMAAVDNLTEVLQQELGQPLNPANSITQQTIERFLDDARFLRTIFGGELF
ncbi:hypothetical protein ColTof4_14400 [Colletotrichum tofieldiae]|nr:hypothetical protein ColTof3_14880 [Colletotrichum tofieldiae]GKT81977.1 hypothetical protein ColTof4_14400 [Colletotrichum tofieldiae]